MPHLHLIELAAERERRCPQVRASKALLEQVTAAELQAEAAHWDWQASCVIKLVMPKRRCGCGGKAPSEAQLRAVLDEVLRGRGELAPWAAETSRQSLRELLAAEPAPGRVLSREAHEAAGFETLMLSNGITLLVKPTRLQDDQLLMAGYARGGLSELAPKAYFSGALADLIATESGAFGCLPRELTEILAGKSVTVSTEHSMYQRRFWAECSPHDLEECVQLLHLLFTTPRRPTRPALQQIRQLLMEGVINQQRDPFAQWSERVTAVNTRGHPRFRKPTIWDVRAVDPAAACTHFDASFAAPGEFTLVMVGSVDLARALPLLETWLASIPAPAGARPNAPLSPEALTVLDVAFPLGVVKEQVVLPMVDPASTVQLTWPIRLDAARSQFRQCHELALVCKLVESRLLKRLRFADSNVHPRTRPAPPPLPPAPPLTPRSHVLPLPLPPSLPVRCTPAKYPSTSGRTPRPTRACQCAARCRSASRPTPTAPKSPRSRRRQPPHTSPPPSTSPLPPSPSTKPRPPPRRPSCND